MAGISPHLFEMSVTVVAAVAMMKYAHIILEMHVGVPVILVPQATEHSRCLCYR